MSLNNHIFSKQRDVVANLKQNPSPQSKYSLIRVNPTYIRVIDLSTGDLFNIPHAEKDKYNIINIADEHIYQPPNTPPNGLTPYKTLTIVGYVDVPMNKRNIYPNKVILNDPATGKINKEIFVGVVSKVYLVAVNEEKLIWRSVYELLPFISYGYKILNGEPKEVMKEPFYIYELLPHPKAKTPFPIIEPKVSSEVIRSKREGTMVVLDCKLIPPHERTGIVDKIDGVDEVKIINVNSLFNGQVNTLQFNGDYKTINCDWLSYSSSMRKLIFTGEIDKLVGITTDAEINKVNILENCFNYTHSSLMPRVTINNNPHTFINSFNISSLYREPNHLTTKTMTNTLKHARVIINSFKNKDPKQVINLNKNCEEFRIQLNYKETPCKVIVNSSKTRVYGEIKTSTFSDDELTDPIVVEVPANYKHVINTTTMTMVKRNAAQPKWLEAQIKAEQRIKLINVPAYLVKLYPYKINLHDKEFDKALKILKDQMTVREYYKAVEDSLNRATDPNSYITSELQELNKDYNVFTFDGISILFSLTQNLSYPIRLGYVKKVTRDLYFGVSMDTGIAYFIHTEPKYFFNENNHLTYREPYSYREDYYRAVYFPTNQITFAEEPLNPDKLKDNTVKKIEVEHVDEHTDIIMCLNWQGEMIAMYGINTSDVKTLNQVRIVTDFRKQKKRYEFDIAKLKQNIK